MIIAEVDYSLIPKGDGGGGSSATCSIDSDCNDDSPCTVDNCESGLCTHTPEPVGTDCGSVVCVSSSTCDVTGECVTESVMTDDGNACTTDACDPASGAITHTPVDTNDKIACTTDACDPSTGNVTHTPENAGCLAWQPLPTTGAPSARQQHTAIWTGSKMIIWGGQTNLIDPPLNTGAVYDPTNHTWTPTSMTGAPSGRHSHQAVWTGSKMIVWGGFAKGTAATGGALYDPETDTWSAMTTTNEPFPRIRHSAIWTGTAMLIFGGLYNNSPITQGAAYNPTTNTWTNLPSSGQASPRYNHSAVWNDNRMIIWGGQNYSDWLATGASFDPATNAWTGATSTTNAPLTREQHSGVWTGSQMLIWGGWDGGVQLNSGALYDPTTSTWTTMSTTNAPSPRTEHVGLWTGKTFVAWGGCGTDLCAVVYGDGAIYTPDANGGSWVTIPEAPTLTARRRPTAVWTGTSIIVWGGRDAGGSVGTGAEVTL